MAVTFKQNFLLFKKVESFRKKYGGPQIKGLPLYMPLTPRFEIAREIEEKVCDQLIEEVEGMLYGYHDLYEISFEGLVMGPNKHMKLSMKPNLDDDFRFVQEHLNSILADLEIQYIKEKNFKVLLHLASLNCEAQYIEAIDWARNIFHFPLDLLVNSLTLFEWRNGEAYPRSILYDFEAFSPNKMGSERSEIAPWDLR